MSKLIDLGDGVVLEVSGCSCQIHCGDERLLTFTATPERLRMAATRLMRLCGGADTHTEETLSCGHFLDAPVPQHALDAACGHYREWAEGRTLREAWGMCPHSDWLLWLVEKLDTGTVEALEAECPRLDRCARAYPDYALESAARLLTPERLDQCAGERPDYALEYAAGLLTPERLDWCAVECPSYALEYAAGLLTPERLDWLAGACPGHALKYAAHLLTPECLDRCAVKRPDYALKHAAHRLTAKRLDWCAVACPGFALRYAARLLTPERLKGLAAPRTNSRTSAWIGPGKRCE